MKPPPPQAALLAASLAWNYQRSKRNRPTISQFTRRHPVVFVLGWTALNAWLPDHILKER
jgi:hypothetical protein